MPRRTLTLYRGTQSPKPEGVRETASWTPSLPVAVIWSAHPGNVWESVKPHFLRESTVHTARLSTVRVLDLSEYTHVTFGTVLRKLKFMKRGGIGRGEAVKVLRYLHNRLIGRARGGDFKYQVLDETDGEPLDPDDLPFSIMNPITLISRLQEDFEMADDAGEALDAADRLEADTFVFADAPAVARAASALGHEVLWYPDVFDGGEFAAPVLLSMDVEDLEGVTMDTDLEGEDVPTHDTYRPLTDGAVTPVEAVRTLALLETIDRRELERRR